MAELLEAVVLSTAPMVLNGIRWSQQVAERVGRGTARVINVACFASVKEISKIPPAPAAVWYMLVVGLH